MLRNFNDPNWGTLLQKKPQCYEKMNEMKVLIKEKCGTCFYKVECMIKSAKKIGELQ